MAHVYKPTYSRAVPAGAERCDHKGKPAVRWRGRNGQWVYGRLCDKPGRCLVETAVWYVAYEGPDGKPATPRKGYADRAATEALMVSLVTTAARVAAGLLPPEAARPRLTLTDLLARWHRYVAAGKAAEKGAARQFQRASDVVTGVGAVRPADLTPSAVMEWIDARRRADRHKGRPFGPGTAANYVGAVKSFTRWLCLTEKVEPVDHLSGLKKSSDPAGIRRKRRALSPAELDALLAAALASPATHYGLTGPERHALYLLACTTGLRAEELSKLTPAAFGEGTVHVEVGAKNKQSHTLPVPPAVMAVAEKLFHGGKPLWPNRGKPSQAWWLNGARMVRRDLAAAGIAAEAGGRVFDFHSLRGQFATDLDRAGVTLSRAQKLMRHSTPLLTAKHYQRPEAAELAGDVAKLRRGESCGESCAAGRPDLSRPDPTPAAKPAGSDNKSPRVSRGKPRK